MHPWNPLLVRSVFTSQWPEVWWLGKLGIRERYHLVGKINRNLEVSPMAFCQVTGALVWSKIVATLPLESGRSQDFLSRALAMLCGEKARRRPLQCAGMDGQAYDWDCPKFTAMAKIDLRFMANLSNTDPDHV